VWGCDYKEVEEDKALVGDFDYFTASGGGNFKIDQSLYKNEISLRKW
jgi:hypothetical protein